jgi:hypothetical protein
MSCLRRVVRVLPIILLIALIASCDDFFVSNSSVVSVSVTPAAVLLKAGNTPAADTYTFSSSALTAGGTTVNDTANATWSSNNSNAATAAAGGVVTAVGTTGGLNATITAKDGGQSGTALVLTYTGTAPTTLSVNAPSNSVSPGTSFSVTATAPSLSGITNANITQYVTWSSSNTLVATVDNNGNVTVLSTATSGFTITATATFGMAASPGTAMGQTTFIVI